MLRLHGNWEGHPHCTIQRGVSTTMVLYDVSMGWKHKSNFYFVFQPKYSVHQLPIINLRVSFIFILYPFWDVEKIWKLSAVFQNGGRAISRLFLSRITLLVAIKFQKSNFTVQFFWWVLLLLEQFEAEQLVVQKKRNSEINTSLTRCLYK